MLIKKFLALPTWIINRTLIRIVFWEDMFSELRKLPLEDWYEGRTYTCKLFDLGFWFWSLLVIFSIVGFILK